VKEAKKKRGGLIGDSERESETVGDREKLFGNKGERPQSIVVVNIKEFEDTLPNVIR
jgi:hypothetical protein